MSGMFDQVFELPTFREFVRRVADALVVEHHSVIVVLPGSMEVDTITSRVYRDTLHREPRKRDVVVRDGIEPLKLMAEAEGVRYQGRLTIEKLLAQSEKQLTEGERSAILHITELGKTSPETQHLWFELFAHWAEVAQTRSSENLVTPALLLILDANRLAQDLPSSNVFLRILWFKQLSGLEMQLLCRLQTDTKVDEILAGWREQILPDLVGNDLGLLEQLWDPIGLIRSVDDLMARLREYANSQRWNGNVDAQSVASLPITTHVDHLEAPQRKLWAQGLLYHTPENGWEIHSALLAVMNRRPEVAHRYWRGQARLLLPFVDHVRHSILTRLTLRYGNAWPSQWIDPPVQDASQVEWGSLKHFAEHNTQADGTRKWRRLISLGWGIRNKIAHYEPITVAEYRVLKEEYGRFSQERM